MLFTVLWTLLGLFVTNTSYALEISADTTITDTATFSDGITVASGVTVTIASASSYSFGGPVDVKGTLNIVGDSTNGLTGLGFASTVTIESTGNLNIENIKPTGDAASYVIAPQSLNNAGTLTLSLLPNLPSVDGSFGYNFTLAPTGSFVNTGTIDYDSAHKGGSSTGFIYLGAMTNNGVITTVGFSAVLSSGSYNYPERNLFKGYVINNPVGGTGSIEGSDRAVYVLDTNSIPNQTYKVTNAVYIINPENFQTTKNFDNYVGSMFILLNVNYNDWVSNNYGSDSSDWGISFGAFDHIYYLDKQCPGYKNTYRSSLITRPFLKYQIGGVLLYVIQFDTACEGIVLFRPTSTTTTVTVQSATRVQIVSTEVTSTTNSFGCTIPNTVYFVGVPPLSTFYTTTTASVTAPVTSTYTTLTVQNGYATSRVVVVVMTPPPSTISTTTTGSVDALTTTTYTTTTTDVSGSSSPEVVVVVITPSPSTVSTTTTGTVTVPTTSTYTSTVTDSTGSSSPEVVVVVITPSLSTSASASSPVSTIHTTLAGSVTAPTTSTYTTTVTGSDGSVTEQTVIAVITPRSSASASASESPSVSVSASSPVSAIHTTLAGSVTAPTTSTYTTTVTGSDGSTTEQIILAVITPFSSASASTSASASSPVSAIHTTLAGSVTAPTTSTYTTTVTGSDGSVTEQTVIAVITPSPSTIYTTVGCTASTPSTSTYTTTVVGTDGAAIQQIVVAILTPQAKSSGTSATSGMSSAIYRNSTIVGGSSSTMMAHSSVTGSSPISPTDTISQSNSLLSKSRDSKSIIVASNTIITSSKVASSVVDTNLPSVTMGSFGETLSKGFEQASTADRTMPTKSSDKAQNSASDNLASANDSGVMASKSQLTSSVSLMSQSIPISSESVHNSVHNQITTLLESYEGRGSTLNFKWSLLHLITALLFMII